MRLRISILCTALLCSPVLAQHLRRGIIEAELLVIAKQVEVENEGEQFRRHRLEILEALRGENPGTVTIYSLRQVADQPRPVDQAVRLYCLSRDKREGLPTAQHPKFRMLGYSGSNPQVDPKSEDDAILGFARVLMASEEGASPGTTCDALFDMVIGENRIARDEALQSLRERNIVAAKMSAIQLSNLLSMAVAETEDIPFKINLASLCAEREMRGVIEALCISLDRVGDPRFTASLGRMAQRIHKDEAASILQAEILKARSPEKRARLLHALGSTQSPRALEALLRYRKVNGSSAPVDAALRAHGSKQALAILENSGKGK
ncbi:MAG: hypothetical protein ACYTG5_11785 [Planctomycetota bacterium]|jgi:hypothetical protein